MERAARSIPAGPVPLATLLLKVVHGSTEYVCHAGAAQITDQYALVGVADQGIRPTRQYPVAPSGTG